MSLCRLAPHPDEPIGYDGSRGGAALDIPIEELKTTRDAALRWLVDGDIRTLDGGYHSIYTPETGAYKDWYEGETSLVCTAGAVLALDSAGYEELALRSAEHICDLAAEGNGKWRGALRAGRRSGYVVANYVSTAVLALLRAYERSRNVRFLEVATAASDFVMDHMQRRDGSIHSPGPLLEQEAGPPDSPPPSSADLAGPLHRRPRPTLGGDRQELLDERVRPIAAKTVSSRSAAFAPQASPGSSNPLSSSTTRPSFDTSSIACGRASRRGSKSTTRSRRIPTRPSLPSLSRPARAWRSLPAVSSCVAARRAGAPNEWSSRDRGAGAGRGPRDRRDPCGVGRGAGCPDTARGCQAGCRALQPSRHRLGRDADGRPARAVRLR